MLHAGRIDMAMSNVFLVRMPDPWSGAGERAKTTWSPAHGYFQLMDTTFKRTRRA